jgi:hypothetical protein
VSIDVGFSNSLANTQSDQKQSAEIKQLNLAVRYDALPQESFDTINDAQCAGKNGGYVTAIPNTPTLP